MQTARLFAPSTVDDRYRPIIEREAVLVAELASRRRVHAYDLTARLAVRAVPADVMGFGDGHHRCPGGYLAIQVPAICVMRTRWQPVLWRFYKCTSGRAASDDGWQCWDLACLPLRSP